MNSKERKQLVESYSREHAGLPQAQIPQQGARSYLKEPVPLLGLMLKCAACVALAALLVVIGSGDDKAGMAKDARSNTAHPAAVVNLSGAAAHRKEVFDERRAHFERDGTAPGNHFAAVTPSDPANAKGITEATCSGGVDGGMDASGNECGKGPVAAAR
ncbi:MAG: hypothetical protein ABI624_03540 [Casimicrobiaceae bacterium]